VASTRELQPWLKPYADWLLAYGRSFAPSLVVTSAYRSPISQARLYQRWQRGESKIPAAPPGRSRHQQRIAFDMARPGVDPLNDPVLNYLGEIWRIMGGRWGAARDPVHFDV